jgi:uncharacterized protein YkwD
MKFLAWGLVLVSAGVTVAQQPTTPHKTVNAKATQESVGAGGKDTQGQTKVKTVSATTTKPATKEETKAANVKAAQKQATASSQLKTQAVPLHQHPTMVTMLQRSNSIRGRVGLRGHRLNPALCRAAQNHAEYMAATGSFSHYTNGGYIYRARRFGFRGGVRENIGWNYPTIGSAFAGWEGSGGHYAAIVSPETSDAGFGYAKSPNGQTYWVSVYGAATKQDLAEVKAIQAKDKLAAEEAAKKKAEAEAIAAKAAADAKVVPVLAEAEGKGAQGKGIAKTLGPDFD